MLIGMKKPGLWPIMGVTATAYLWAMSPHGHGQHQDEAPVPASEAMLSVSAPSSSGVQIGAGGWNAPVPDSVVDQTYSPSPFVQWMFGRRQ